MRNTIVYGMIFVFILVGCATSKGGRMSTAQSRARINDLERELAEKDDEMRYLKSELTKAENELERQKDVSIYSFKKSVSKGRGKDSPIAATKQIQVALKNAGFYNGSIDGKIGSETKKAITEFQKANGLKADGIVGQQTWSRLKEFVN